ncbi:MAG: hypothetical protein L6Q59_16005 [Ignavibacteriaceae bacterium]|nr:hypothetical protein [Ignavibacteriaceae bacterium]
MKINSKWLMVSSAVVLGVFGLLTSFFAKELLLHTKVTSGGAGEMFMQFLAAGMLGFAFMNWTGRNAVLGGIYGRPIIMGNLIHFSLVLIAMVKMLIAKPDLPGMWVLAGIYLIFTLGFLNAMLFHPAGKTGQEQGG